MITLRIIESSTRVIFSLFLPPSSNLTNIRNKLQRVVWWTHIPVSVRVCWVLSWIGRIKQNITLKLDNHLKLKPLREARRLLLFLSLLLLFLLSLLLLLLLVAILESSLLCLLLHTRRTDSERESESEMEQEGRRRAKAQRKQMRSRLSLILQLLLSLFFSLLLSLLLLLLLSVTSLKCR